MYKSNTLKKYFKPMLLIFIPLILIFIYSLIARYLWIGKLSNGDLEWITQYTIIYVNNWIDYNPFQYFFALTESPKSVEILNPIIYPSYPPGSFIPFYLISLILNIKANSVMVAIYSLLNQFLISAILALTAYILLGNSNSRMRILAAIFAGAFYILIPYSFAIHQNLYYSDIFIIIFFVLANFIELICIKYRKNLYWLSSIIIFIGAFSDWLFFFYAVVLFCSRSIFYKNKTILFNFFQIFIPVAIALALFLLQTWHANDFNFLLSKFTTRSFVDSEHLVNNFFHDFWLKHFYKAGFAVLSISVFLLLALLVKYLVTVKNTSNERNLITLNNFKLNIYILTIYICTPILRVYILQQHSVDHSFVSLIFIPYFSLAPFILIPNLLNTALDLSRNNNILKKLRYFFNLKLGIIIGVIGLIVSYPNYKNLHLTPIFVGKNLSSYIAENGTYNDIYFSPNFISERYPPGFLYFSHKFVYEARSIDTIDKIVQPIKEKYNINIVIKKDSSCIKNSLDDKLAPTVVVGEFAIYQLPIDFYNKIKMDNAQLYKENICIN